MKKLLSVVIALAMVLSTASISFADESQDQAIEVKSVTEESPANSGDVLGEALDSVEKKSQLAAMASEDFGYVEMTTGSEELKDYVGGVEFSGRDRVSYGKYGACVPITFDKRGVLNIAAQATSENSTKAIVYGLFRDKEMTNPVGYLTVYSDKKIWGGLEDTTFKVDKGTYYLGMYSGQADKFTVANLACFVSSKGRILTSGKYAAVGQTDTQTNYFKFTAESSGALKVTTEGLNGAIQLLSSSKKGISSRKSISESYPTTMYGVAKGETYYIKVTGNTNPYGYYKIMAKSASVSEKSGTRKLNAKSISKGKAKTGTITAGSGRADVYKFKLSSKKNVTVTMKGANCDKLVMSVYKGRKELESVTFTNKTANAKIYGKFPKGTYYVRIARGNSGSSGYYNVTWK